MDVKATSKNSAKNASTEIWFSRQQSGTGHFSYVNPTGFDSFGDRMHRIRALTSIAPNYDI